MAVRTKVLLTGGLGFSGSYIAEAITQLGWDLIILDLPTYAGKWENVASIPPDRLNFIQHDFREPLDALFPLLEGVDAIIHCGAETHVINSLSDPKIFVESNVVGTFNLLEAARKLKPKQFVYISTDEVFGAATTPHKEDDALMPSNPYSATKAAGEELVRSYGRCFGIPYIITRTTNMFGKRQHEEKFVPMTIQKIKNHQMVQVHADAEGNIGSRQWIHASDQAAAIIFLLQSGQRNDTFHIAGERKTNKEIAEAVALKLDAALYLEYFNAYSRWPGHDLHYALDDSKIRTLGWKPKLTFEQGLALTV